MALSGIKFRANPTAKQKQVLSQWMGCARFIWNAKCEENSYLYSFKKKYLPVTTKMLLDQSYSQFKSTELSPWLFDCPSQILRNTMHTWRKTMSSFFKGNCGIPKKKKKSNGGSIWLTSELFSFEKAKNNKIKLLIGTKKNNIGYLNIKAHREFNNPKSIRIKQKNGQYTVSFCYEGEDCINNDLTKLENLNILSRISRNDLENIVIGVDRGVAIPVHTGDQSYDFSYGQKKHKNNSTISIRVLQKKLSRQTKGSNQRNKTKQRIAKKHQKIANIREDFAHQTSCKIVNKTEVIIFEDLKTDKLTKKPKAKLKENGRYKKNGAKAKAGLNKAILDKGWGQIENFCAYKAEKQGKDFFKIDAKYTSQECADCGHTHSNNRITQATFLCEHCGHTDNADRNAALVIKKRAINLILDPGTGLSARGVLIPSKHRARSLHKTEKDNSFSAMGVEVSKMISESLAA